MYHLPAWAGQRGWEVGGGHWEGRTAGGSCVRAACLSGHRQCGQARRRHGRVRGWQASVRARARRNLWADGRVCVADAAEDTV